MSKTSSSIDEFIQKIRQKHEDKKKKKHRETWKMQKAKTRIFPLQTG